MLKTYMVILIPKAQKSKDVWDIAVARIRTYVRAESSKEARKIAEIGLGDTCHLDMVAQYSRCIDNDEKGKQDFEKFMDAFILKGE